MTSEVGRVVTATEARSRGFPLLIVAALAVGAAGGASAALLGGSSSAPEREAAAPRATTTIARLAPPLSQPAPDSRTSALPPPGSGFVAGQNQLLVDGTGHSVARVFIASRCTPGAPLPSIPIAPDGAFRLNTTLDGPPRTSVTLSGRFVGAASVVVRARFVAVGCDSGVIRRTLRRI